MTSPEIVILGRSPFINQVNVPELLKRFPSIGINHIAQQFPVDYVFSFDGCIVDHKAAMAYAPNYYNCSDCVPYVPRSTDSPILEHTRQDGAIVLGFRYFTVSVAVNWAILEGYKKIYLVGIDHVETDKQFLHNDGTRTEAELTPEAHRAVKEFIRVCASYADIYQCNPDVDWPIPYKDVRELSHANYPPR